MTANRPSVVTIGAYDGVHLGHRRVIERVVSLARQSGLRSVVVTFDRHPASVVRPESAPRLLTDLDQKLELLRSAGVDDVEVIRFDEERATEPAEDFVEEVLIGQLSSRLVVVGRDFHFGKGRGGNVALLEQMGAAGGFEVVPFDLVTDADSEPVSSTRIRNLIAAGDLDAAASLLGRRHEVRGAVTGFVAADGWASGAAATVSVDGKILLPPPGVYQVSAGPADGELARAQALISPAGELVVAGLGSDLEAGGRLRVLFGNWEGTAAADGDGAGADG